MEGDEAKYSWAQPPFLHLVSRERERERTKIKSFFTFIPYITILYGWINCWCWIFRILEMAPAVKNMFPFLKDSDEIPQNNPKLKAHAFIVFNMVSFYFPRLHLCMNIVNTLYCLFDFLRPKGWNIVNTQKTQNFTYYSRSHNLNLIFLNTFSDLLVAAKNLSDCKCKQYMHQHHTISDVSVSNTCPCQTHQIFYVRVTILRKKNYLSKFLLF